MSEPRDLEQAFRDLREASADKAASIDVTSSVLAAIEPPPRARRWLWAMAGAPIALACAALLLWWLAGSSAPTVTTQGELVANGRAVASGEVVSLPASFVAGASRGAQLLSSRTEIAVWPTTAVGLDHPRTVATLSGGVTISSTGEVEVRTDIGVIRGRGVFDVETVREGVPMTLTRNHKIAGVVAIAVAVSAGWIVFRDNDGNETRIEEPGTAAIDSNGEVTELGARARAGATQGSLAPARAGDDSSEASAGPLSGAFWDEGEQRIVFALSGEVVDGATGSPITDFDLSASPIQSDGFGQGNSIKRSFRDSKAGGFVLNNLGLGTWQLEVRADGYAPSSQTVELADLYSNPLLLFPLTPGAQITGQVVDWKGRAVKGARVGQPVCLDGKPGPGCTVATSDDDGNFVLPATPEERAFALRAEHKKYGFAELKNLRHAEGSTRHVVIRLSGVLRIEGHVTRGPDAAPVAGAIVGVRSGERAETSATGAYEILVPLEARPEAFVESDPNRPRSRARIVSHARGRSARELRWVSAETHVAEVEIDFQLQMEAATITGVVTDGAGKALADISLRFTNSAGWKRKRGHETFPTTATTDAEGRYTLRDVPFEAGYDVTFRNDKDERINLGFVTVAREETVVANFVLGAGGIRGELVDKSGKRFAASIRGCQRLGARGSDGTHARPRCYADGRFEFARLAPGKYVLENRLPTQSSPLVISPTDVEVPATGVASDVTVTVEGEPSQEWRFRILDSSGRFVPGVGIRYNHGNTKFTSSLNVEADGLARVSLSRLYLTVYIDAPGYRSVEVGLGTREPSEVIELRMERKSDD